MSGIACNVVLLPEPEVAKRAIAVSEQLAVHGVHFTLAEGEFFPHVSLYMLQLQMSNLPDAENRLQEIATSLQPVNLEAARYGQSMQFLDAEYEKTQVVSEVQNAVVATLNPIRDGMRAKDVERMQAATGLALENYKNYGWNSIGELYRPHLTLTRFTADQDISDALLPAVETFSGAFSKLGLFEMGDNGTCVRKIVEFTLQ